MTTAHGAMILAPFTAEQVVHLNGYQLSSEMHPFTCPTEHPDGHRVLVATLHGWVCPDCAYDQSWAHIFMADWPHGPSNCVSALREARRG
ncbi:hypothetical protein [Streptomyces sp. CBMA29]|uniref:hypothetical protein n=1 Tax=Streptomyces sp. CBMA29 TaxID=1896314 RepID=UPI001661E3D1|nr:hypothetical protein [Streptomyces sp. CBMA29]MBD0734028.1 hypothetical protein [Streptomyces sp. CBMA29]